MPTPGDIAVRQFNRGRSLNALHRRITRTQMSQTLAALELRLDLPVRTLADIRKTVQHLQDRHPDVRMKHHTRVRIVTWVLSTMRRDTHYNRTQLREWYGIKEQENG